jgi:hypothetical protein
MSPIIANDDMFAYILIFLPCITNLTYISDTAMSDIHNIYKLSLVSKTLYYYCSFGNNSIKKKSYKEFLYNSHELRKICNCKDVFFTFTKNINIAEFAFKQIYKKYNIVKKRNTPFHKNFSKSTINYIILEKKFSYDHIIIIYDIIELGVLAIEQKHNAIIQKINDIMKFYTVLSFDVFKLYVKYIIDVTTNSKDSLLHSYFHDTKKLLKISIWSLLFAIMKINEKQFAELELSTTTLFDTWRTKKTEMVEEIKKLSGTCRQFPKHFCKSIVSYYEDL